MPRGSKKAETDVSKKAEAAAVAEAQEDAKVEEVAAAYFAAQTKSGAGEEEPTEVDEKSTEPVLERSDTEADGGSSDVSGEEAGGDESGDGEVSGELPEPEVETEETAVLDDDIDPGTAAEKRPTTAGGLTVITT